MRDNDLISIKDFSALTGINQSTLRYYDKINLFRPMRRGENGYRYYSVMQSITINFINVMNSLGVPLKKIIKFKNARTPSLMLDFLHQQELSLNQELYRLQQTYAIVHTYCSIIHEGLKADADEITCRNMDLTSIELGMENDFSSGSFYDSFFKFVEYMDECKTSAAYPVGGFYNDMGAFANSPGQPNRFFSITPTGRNAKAEGEYLVGYTKGYYGNIGDLPARMLEYAKDNKLVFNGPVYEIYLHDEVSNESHDQFLVQVSVPIKHKD